MNERRHNPDRPNDLNQFEPDPERCDREEALFISVTEQAAALYDRKRDPNLLQWLLDEQTANRREHDAQIRALLSLWDVHWAEILSLAYGQDHRCRRIAETLLYAIRAQPIPSARRLFTRNLRRAILGQNVQRRRVARTVRTLLAAWLTRPRPDQDLQPGDMEHQRRPRS